MSAAAPTGARPGGPGGPGPMLTDPFTAVPAALGQGRRATPDIAAVGDPNTGNPSAVCR